MNIDQINDKIRAAVDAERAERLDELYDELIWKQYQALYVYATGGENA